MLSSVSKVLLLAVAIAQSWSSTFAQSLDVQPLSSNILARIAISPDGKNFIKTDSGQRFLIWGVNYDHDAEGRLIEDYWHQHWDQVEQDFSEIKQLGANTVRVHLQLGKFMRQADQPNEENLRQLRRLVSLAEQNGLYLDITGLGCYHRRDIPAWYDSLDESDRWQVQARFWEAVAQSCSSSTAVICFDLMNEPIVPGDEKKETDWLAGEFAGKHFVQRIARELKGRKRNEVVEGWIDQMVSAIRKHDPKALITIGEIPWSHVWPGADPVFYTPESLSKLDFVSIHLYPKRGEVDKAIKAIGPYMLGKPLVIEEMFPLECSIDELEQFIDRSRSSCDGWIGFYWGKTELEYRMDEATIANTLLAAWLEYFASKSETILALKPPE